VPFDGKNPSAVMHKHLKAELVPPDHANPKLSPGISEVIEMMMAKAPRDRYQNCADLLADVRAVRAKQTPPIAHKDLGGLDLESLAKAEAAAPGATVDKTVPTKTVMVRPIFLKVLIASLGVSLLGNLILAILSMR
jgi:serine/threonine-protein kinase